jgi:hypothetical protein
LDRDLESFRQGMARPGSVPSKDSSCCDSAGSRVFRGKKGSS